MARRTFAPGNTVEIVRDPMGYRGAKAADGDWKPAVYLRAGQLGMRGWHEVMHRGQREWIPNRRIRAQKAAP